MATFGAVVALAGCFALPFVEFRANRIVSGDPQGLGSAGMFGLLLAILCAGGLVASLLLAKRGRSGILPAGAAIVGLLPWTLGAAAVSLQEGASPVARVSVGAGAWLVLVGGAIVWFAGTRTSRPALSGTAVALGVVASVVASVAWGGLTELSLAREYLAQSERFWQLVREHLTLSGSGLGLGVLAGVPLGVAASRSRVIREAALGVAGVIQTVPSLALLGLLVLPLAALGLPGIGTLPAVIALTLYALLPIVRNTYVGLAGVDASALDAGRGMGMNRFQLLIRVEAPLALPLVLEGIRASALLVIGIAAVTAFVGAGGLGVLVFLGWGQQADDLTLLGALPMVVLALAADVGMRLLARATVSPGIREVGP